MVGTMRHNRVGLPKEVKQFTDREPFSTQIWWEKSKQKISLTSYVVPSKSKGRKNVIVLSSQEPYLGVIKDEKAKPQIIKFYDFTKGGTDIVDQRSVSFTTSTKTKKWTRKTLSFMLDTTRVNSQTIHSLNNDVHPRSSDSAAFAYNLGLSLIRPHLEIRKSTNGLQSHVLDKIALFLPSEREKVLVPKKGEEILSYSKKGENRRCRSCLNEARGEGDKK